MLLCQPISCSICNLQGLYKMIEGVSEPVVAIDYPDNGTCAEIRDGQVYAVRSDITETLHVECFGKSITLY